jgi:hypothetical protein
MLPRRYEVLSALAEDSDDFNQRRERRFSLCVVVATDIFERLRWQVADSKIDLFVIGAARLTALLERGAEQHLVRLCAFSHHAFGEESLGKMFRANAADRMAGPAPDPSPGTIFRFRCQPFDLLRSFYELRDTDRTEAGVVAATLVRAVIASSLG